MACRSCDPPVTATNGRTAWPRGQSSPPYDGIARGHAGVGVSRQKQKLPEAIPMSDPIPFRPYAAGTQPSLDSPDYLGTHKRHPRHSLHKLPHTITETTGPAFSPALFPPMADMTTIDGRRVV